jgi:hypothetical protein
LTLKKLECFSSSSDYLFGFGRGRKNDRGNKELPRNWKSMKLAMRLKFDLESQSADLYIILKFCHLITPIHPQTPYL